MSFKETVFNLIQNQVIETPESNDQILTVLIHKNDLKSVCQTLKTHESTQLDMLTDLTIVDWLKWPQPKINRFLYVIHLFSTKSLQRVRIQCDIEEKDTTIDSLTSIWRNANWLEREAWDMYGIKFNDHPDLRRILMYAEFEGHPLRKDYPIDKRQPLIGPMN